MKCIHLIYALFVLNYCPAFGQTASVSKEDSKTMVKYQVAITAGAERNYFLYKGVGIQARYQFTDRIFMDARTFFPPVIPFFDPSRQFVRDQYGIGSPTYNQTSAVAGFSLLKTHKTDHHKGLTPGRTGDREKNKALSVRVGYYFYQQTLTNTRGFADSYSNQYYIVDTNSAGDNLYRSGTIAHSFSAGLDFFTSKTINEKKLSTSHIYVDFLYGFAMRTTAFRENKILEIYPYRFDDSRFRIDRVGFRVGYEYTRNFSEKWGIIIGVEIVKKPWIYHDYNQALFVIRGSENTGPFTGSVKLGISYTQLKSMIKSK